MWDSGCSSLDEEVSIYRMEKPQQQEEALTTMDGLVNTAVKGQVVLIAVNAQLADMNGSVENGLINARLDVETLVFLEFARAHFEDRIAHARRPKVNLVSHSHGWMYSSRQCWS